MRAMIINGLPVVTDRALRYRAQANAPDGPKVCGFCGSRKNIDLEHINGHEEDSSPENLMYACRSCNTQKGIHFANVGLGRRTRQYNPAGGARSLGQWLTAVLSAKGEGSMDTAAAVEMIRNTSPAKRSEFAQQIWERRRARGTDSLVPF